MKGCIPLYDNVAARYSALFDAPHRSAYDDLTWELTQQLLPAHMDLIVDAGCGNGRWGERLTQLAAQVVGIDHAPAMARAAHAANIERFEVVEDSIEEISFPEKEADAVLALGSLQYAADPCGTVSRLAAWTRPGGAVLILVDSRLALEIELLRANRDAEARQRVAARRATFVLDDYSADHHLFDRAALEATLRAAGLEPVRTWGLLVGASLWGREELTRRLRVDHERQMSIERRLAAQPGLADLGKQLLVYARRPG